MKCVLLLSISCRIVVAGGVGDYVVAESADVFLFDQEYGLTQQQVRVWRCVWGGDVCGVGWGCAEMCVCGITLSHAAYITVISTYTPHTNTHTHHTLTHTPHTTHTHHTLLAYTTSPHTPGLHNAFFPPYAGTGSE